MFMPKPNAKEFNIINSKSIQITDIIFKQLPLEPSTFIYIIE